MIEKRKSFIDNPVYQVSLYFLYEINNSKVIDCGKYYHSIRIRPYFARVSVEKSLSRTCKCILHFENMKNWEINKLGVWKLIVQFSSLGTTFSVSFVLKYSWDT